MSKIIGVEHKKGEMQQNFKGTGVFYDYYLIHCMTSNALNELEVKGNLSNIVKVRQSDIPDKNPLNWIGKDFEINYDEKHRIKSILLDDKVVYKNEVLI